MSKLFLVLVCSSVIIFSQSKNPDGEYPSLHVTPFLTWGNDNQFRDQRTISYETAFSFAVLIKFPINNSITLSPFYEQNAMRFKAPPATSNSPQGTTYDGKFKKLGFTFSFYVN